MLKKIWNFIMFILPFTQSKVQDARLVLASVDKALGLLETQQSRVVAELERDMAQLEHEKALAESQVAEALTLRSAVAGK